VTSLPREDQAKKILAADKAAGTSTATWFTR